MSDKRPDPEAKYVATQGFMAAREPGGEPVNVYPGKQLDGDDPLVIKYPERFKVDPEYIQAALLDAIRARAVELADPAPEGHAGGTTVTPRPAGRQPWTARLFDDRYAEAVKLAGGNTSDAAVAKHFVGLNAQRERGIEPGSLARLRRRRANGHMPK